jgi:predicted ATP-grasp superfamily ATP-dependent carboligase
MRVFVYEYVCGGGLAGQPLPESLRQQGWAMLRAAVDDLARCPGVEVTTLIDSRWGMIAEESEGVRVDFVDPGEEPALYRERTGEADFTLVIAPEFDDLLYERCLWTEEAGGQLLGPSRWAVRSTGDKRWLGDLWRGTRVPTPAFYVRCPHQRTGIRFPVVWKPRHGAGSRGIFVAHTLAELVDRYPRSSKAVKDELVIQPFVSGLPVSVSVMIGDSGCLALPAAAQHLSNDGRLGYLGGRLPLSDDMNDRAQKLALQAVAPVDDLLGYVGVDLILGHAPDGSEDVAIEINPRLTTSYVGLRELAEFNLAETMLALVLGRTLPERRYREGVVEWSADGTVWQRDVQ